MKRNKHEDDISFLGKVLLFFKTQKEKLHDLHFSFQNLIGYLI